MTREVGATNPSQSMKPVRAPEPALTPIDIRLPIAFTMSAIATAWTKDESTVKTQVMPIFSVPGVSPSALPMPFHQVLKNVFGLYHSVPLPIPIRTQATTANQLIELKSIFISFRNLKLIIVNLEAITQILYLRCEEI